MYEDIFEKENNTQNQESDTKKIKDSQTNEQIDEVETSQTAQQFENIEQIDKIEQVTQEYANPYTVNSDTYKTSENINSNVSGEYHHSYVNNPYNPNVNSYSRPNQYYGYNSNQTVNTNPYQTQQNTTPYHTSQNPYQNRTYQTNQNNSNFNKPKKEKGPKGRVSAGTIAIILIVCILLSGLCGFCGTMLYNKLNQNGNNSDAMIIHQVEPINQEASEKLEDKSTSQIASEVADSVVEITTEQMTTNPFYGQAVQQGAGSGVIISEDGYIVTNNHVIADAKSIKVSTRDGESYDAKLIGTDSREDIALIKVEAKGLKPAVLGDSSKIQVGDKAVAIGNPLGTLGGSVTDGVISALDRKVEIDKQSMTLLQIDAAVNPGNSGGGLFNGQGELIGVVNAKSTGEEIDGIGFAIPINRVQDVLSDLKEYGYVTGRPNLGIELLDVPNSMYAFYYFQNSETGVFVYSVDGNNATKAGLKAGDRIAKVNGTEVSTSEEIEQLVEDMKVGDEIKLVVDRSGKSVDISYALEEATPISDAKQNQKNNSQQQDSNDFYGWNPFG